MKLGKLGLAAILGMSFMGCEVVEPGFVGFMVRKTGSNRGVDPTPLYGRVWEGIDEEVITFPTSLQNTIWRRGDPDESISFSVRNGVPINVDVGITFRVEPGKAALLYQRYHQTSLSLLADGEIRNLVRDSIADNAVSMSVEEMLGAGRNQLQERSLERVRSQLGPHGIIVENLTFVSAPRLPENVQTAINASLEAQQRLSQAQARAASELAAAEGRARSQEAAARGDALALRIRTEADVENRRQMATAYRVLGESLNDNVLKYLTIQRWNGALAPTCGGGGGFTQVLAAPVSR